MSTDARIVITVVGAGGYFREEVSVSSRQEEAIATEREKLLKHLESRKPGDTAALSVRLLCPACRNTGFVEVGRIASGPRQILHRRMCANADCMKTVAHEAFTVTAKP